jgi:CRP-like cAMP-binding protein
MSTSPRPSISSEQLAAVPLFRGLSAEALARIRSPAHPIAIDAGDRFFSEGEEADGFFVLIGGRVKLTQLTPEGHQVVLRIVGAGEAFGGAGAFGDATYPIGAEAVEPAAALVWSSAAMRRLLEAEPGVAVNAVQFVANRLHDLQRRYRQLMTERVERRVARALLRLISEAGRRVDTGVEIDFPVSRQDIAEMTGTTIFTVSRLLSTWETRGIIRGGRQRIVLVAPQALVALAEDFPPR